MVEKTRNHQGQSKHQRRTRQGEQKAPMRVTKECLAMLRMSTRGSGRERYRHPTNHRPERLKSTT